MKWLLAILIFTLLGCSSSKKIRTRAATIVQDTTLTEDTGLLEKAKQLLAANNEVPFNTFSAKVKIDYEDLNGKQPETNAFIRMKKDQFIWVSITGTFLNIEAARVWITPDSIIIVNKFEKTIESHPVSFIRDMIALPFSFADIQKLIAGKIALEGDSILTTSSSENFLKINTASTGFDNSLFFTLPGLLLAKQAIDITDGNQNYSAEVLYEDYKKSDDLYFSSIRDISIPAKQQKVQLAFRQYEFNKELSVPFSRPEGYTVK